MCLVEFSDGMQPGEEGGIAMRAVLGDSTWLCPWASTCLMLGEAKGLRVKEASINEEDFCIVEGFWSRFLVCKPQISSRLL